RWISCWSVVIFCKHWWRIAGIMALSLTFNSSPILPVHINPSQFKSLIPLLILTMATPCQATLVVPEEWTNPTFPFLTLATFNVGGNFFGKISQLRSLAEEVDV